MSISKSGENWSVVAIVANWMLVGLMQDRRIRLSCFQEMEPPMREMSGGNGAMGCVPKMEEIVGVSVIIEVCQGEDQVDQEAGSFVACHDLLEKEE